MEPTNGPQKLVQGDSIVDEKGLKRPDWTQLFLQLIPLS